WVFLYEKGYQTQDSIISSVSVKLKGLAMTNESSLGPHIWDVVDYVFPPQGDSSFVVMTNFIITPGQKQGTCPEVNTAASFSGHSFCNLGGCGGGTDERPQRTEYAVLWTSLAELELQSDPINPSIKLSSPVFRDVSSYLYPTGLMTGKCVNYNASLKTCEIFGWCPAEVDYHVPNPALLPEVEKFTIFIKNSITFPKFKVSRRNIVESITTQYLKKCTYHKVTDSLCPMFELGYVVKESGQNFSMLAVKGGVVGITIDWNCDLDWPIRYCKPIYQFHGLYNDDSTVSPGFNFRYAKYYREDGMEKRTLYKVFGIRFDILVNGKAGKFDIIPTMTTIGSGIGIFGVASVLCDLLLLHFLQGRDYYKQKKFKYAEQEPSKSNKKEKELDNAP
ncbi:hypothetical protein CIB84_011021, partial [Bambusicola thoracicus]